MSEPAAVEKAQVKTIDGAISMLNSLRSSIVSSALGMNTQEALLRHYGMKIEQDLRTDHRFTNWLRSESHGVPHWEIEQLGSTWEVKLVSLRMHDNLEVYANVLAVSVFRKHIMPVGIDNVPIELLLFEDHEIRNS